MLEKYSKGEMLGMAMRQELSKNAEMKAAMESDLSKLQASARGRGKDGKKILAKIAKETNGDSYSLNDDETASLLTGDHDEELRQADRVAEKETNAAEGASRLTEEQIAAAAHLKEMRVAGQQHKMTRKATLGEQIVEETISQRSNSNISGLGKRKPKGPGTPSPKFNKFDTALKKDLLVQE